MGPTVLQRPSERGTRRYSSRGTAAATAVILTIAPLYLLTGSLVPIQLRRLPDVEQTLVRLIERPRKPSDDWKFHPIRPRLIAPHLLQDTAPNLRIELPTEAPPLKAEPLKAPSAMAASAARGVGRARAEAGDTSGVKGARAPGKRIRTEQSATPAPVGRARPASLPTCARTICVK